MTAPWSGSEEADGEEELAEGVGSADAVASAVGAVEGAAALGVVAAGLVRAKKTQDRVRVWSEMLIFAQVIWPRFGIRLTHCRTVERLQTPKQ